MVTLCELWIAQQPCEELLLHSSSHRCSQCGKDGSRDSHWETTSSSLCAVRWGHTTGLANRKWAEVTHIISRPSPEPTCRLSSPLIVASEATCLRWWCQKMVGGGEPESLNPCLEQSYQELVLNLHQTLSKKSNGAIGHICYRSRAEPILTNTEGL